MIALYMPMQPSSKIPMIAFPESNRRAIFSPALRDEPGTLTSLNFSTCDVSCLTFPSLSHSSQLLRKKLICELLAPKSAVLHIGFGEGSVQIQQADQTRPCSAPVCHRQNRAVMRNQAAEQMLSVLPHSLGHDQRGILRD